MGRYGLAGFCLSLAVVLAGCSVETPGSVPASLGTASPEPPTVRQTISPPVSTAETPSPGPSAMSPSSDAPPSLNADAMVVRDAALATGAAGAMRFEVEIRSADPADDVPVVTSRGQVSFTEPPQFRYFADAFTGIGGHSPETEVILDDSRLYGRGRDGLVDSPDTWLLIDFDDLGIGAIVRERYLQQYGSVLFMLAPALGITHADLSGRDTIRDTATTRYAGRSNLDLALALLPPVARELYRQSLDSRRKAMEARGIPGPLPHVEIEVWVDADGLIHRLRYVQDVESGDIEGYVITYDFDAFGAPMDLDPPEGAEVLTYAELQERYRSSSAPPSSPG
jgi:hypothetical protein